MRLSFHHHRHFAILVLFLIMGCAAIAPPPGGPEDKTPPSLIFADPPSGTTGIPGEFILTLTFSERLDESAPKKGIRIAPALSVPPQVTLKKDKLAVSFPRELASSQTYLVTLTREILDEHSNRLDRTYQLAFSTGEEISQGVIRGTVFDIRGSSSIVYLYRLEDEDMDSLFLREPDYFTETDDSGHYSFLYLDPGHYQVLALQGGSPPAPIAPLSTPYGVHWKAPLEIEDAETVVDHVDMRISREIPPLEVLSIAMEASHRGTVNFTNSVRLSEQVDHSLAFLDSIESKVVVPDLVFQYRDGDSQLHFRARDLVAGKAYQLYMTSWMDVVGQKLQSYSRLIVIPEADSLAPEVVSPKPDKEKTIDPGKLPLEIQFSDIVQSPDSLEMVQVADTAGAILPLVINWPNPTRMQIRPNNGWLPETDYTVTVFGEKVRSPEGRAMEDSIVVFDVRAGREIGYGRLSGVVRGGFAENSIVVGTPVEKSKISYSTSVNLEGHFEFTKLPAGLWLLHAYQDRDRNGRYTPGKAIPFQPAEPFLFSADTVEIRANWELERVKLEYPGGEDGSD